MPPIYIWFCNRAFTLLLHEGHPFSFGHVRGASHTCALPLDSDGSLRLRLHFANRLQIEHVCFRRLRRRGPIIEAVDGCYSALRAAVVSQRVVQVCPEQGRTGNGVAGSKMRTYPISHSQPENQSNQPAPLDFRGR